MAAAIKALNAKIRSNKVADYVCSTRTFTTSDMFPAALPGPEIGQPQCTLIKRTLRKRVTRDPRNWS
jgi:hypothetical protein